MSEPSIDQAPSSVGAHRAKNLRLALILGSVAVTFFVGFIAEMVLRRG